MTLHFPTGVLRPALACVTALMTLSLAQAHGPAEWDSARWLQERGRGVVLRRTGLLRTVRCRREDHLGRLSRCQHERDDPVPGGDPLA